MIQQLHTNKQLVTASIGVVWLLHISALIGVGLGYGEWFLSLSVWNLLLTFLLLVLMAPIWGMRAVGLSVLFFTVGIGVEWLGVNQGLIFGEYTYGENLGFKWQGVPLIIGVNWVILVWISGILSSHLFSNKLLASLGGAVLMVLLDLAIEQVAPAMDFWQFNVGHAPLTNYVGWFVVSWFLHAIFQFAGLTGQKRFAVHVYLCQLVFFISMMFLIHV